MSKYSNPSPNFMPCIRIFCIMFGLEPDLKQASKFDPNGVFPVVKRRFAKAKEFLMDLQSFQRLETEKLDQVQKILDESKLAIDQVLFTSKSLSVLAKW